ncbi:MAG: thioredoxin family protein [Candidatus Aminicenantales bacterium]
MEILNSEVRLATKKKFDEEMGGMVTLLHFTQEPGRLVLPDSLKGQECLFCRETKQLLEEVSSLSEKIELQVFDFSADKDKAAEFGIDKIPALVIMGERDHGIRFYGIPSGYEYTSLVEAIVDVSRGQTSLSDKTKETLRALDKDIHLQVFVTPTCPYCSISVRLAHQFALESVHIKADMLEATEFPHLSDRFSVMGVPKTVINGQAFIEGALPEDRFLAEILKAVQAPDKT